MPEAPAMPKSMTALNTASMRDILGRVSKYMSFHFAELDNHMERVWQRVMYDGNVDLKYIFTNMAVAAPKIGQEHPHATPASGTGGSACYFVFPRPAALVAEGSPSNLVGCKDISLTIARQTRDKTTAARIKRKQQPRGSKSGPSAQRPRNAPANV